MPSPGPCAPPAAVDEGVLGDRHLIGIAGLRIEEAIDAALHVRDHGIEPDDAGGADAGDADDPHPGHASEKHEARPGQRHQHGLADVRLSDEQRHHDAE